MQNIFSAAALNTCRDMGVLPAFFLIFWLAYADVVQPACLCTLPLAPIKTCFEEEENKYCCLPMLSHICSDFIVRRLTFEHFDYSAFRHLTFWKFQVLNSTNHLYSQKNHFQDAPHYTESLPTPLLGHYNNFSKNRELPPSPTKTKTMQLVTRSSDLNGSPNPNNDESPSKDASHQQREETNNFSCTDIISRRA